MSYEHFEHTAETNDLGLTKNLFLVDMTAEPSPHYSELMRDGIAYYQEGDHHFGMCHIRKKEYPIPTQCPSCRRDDMQTYGLGVDQLAGRAPSIEELDTIAECIGDYIDLESEHQGLAEFRKYLFNYIAGLPGSKELKKKPLQEQSNIVKGERRLMDILATYYNIMYDEIEIKVLEINIEQVTKRLQELGAEKIFDGQLHSRYFSTQSPEELRIRKAHDTCTLDYKYYRMIDSLQKNDEISTPVGDMETTTTILQKLGYTIVEEEHKHRISYRISNHRIDIDTHATIPTYLEIEGNTEDDIRSMIGTLHLQDHLTTNLTADYFKESREVYDAFIAQLKKQ